ncbi:MAG: DNA-directed RNA polymerase [Candidatus Thermoplasmatota archaeon]|jgi:DNA-directed RNA polymerase subunit E'|nr:DNA-directed RNA polymerase [Candidatus Thermoplasmatota archaeon]
MYAIVKVEDTIRIPPERFGEDIDTVVEEIVQKTFEGTMGKDYGLIVVTDNIETIGEGIVIHGDGALYQRVTFKALTFKPELQEILDGIVCEIVEFGAFCHIGPFDALIHMSQIMNDYVEVDSEGEMIVGKEKKQVLKTGDSVRARVVSVSLNELSARESKIGLTMRQPALGSHEWLKAGPAEKDKKKKEEPKKKDEKEKGKK